MPDYTSQQQSLNRRRQLAQALQQQSMAPIEPPQVPGANVSWSQGAQKIAEALFGGLINRKLDKEQTSLDTERQAERSGVTRQMLEALINQPQAIQLPMAPTQAAPIPGEAMPAPQTPEGSRALPILPGQTDRRNAMVQALQGQMTSSDPLLQQYGMLGLQNQLQGQRDERGQQFDMQKLMAQQASQQSQQQAAQQFTAGQNALYKPKENIDPLSTEGIAAQLQLLQARPNSTDPYQTREIERDGVIYIQTYAKGDPKGTTISEIRKGPVKDQPEAGAYVTLTDEQGTIRGFVNPKSRTFVPVDKISGMPDDMMKNALSPERLKLRENASSGLRAIATLREELKNPDVLKSLAVPGSPTARKARAARGEMIDVITRIRTGAALNKDEQAFYRDQAPGLIDALFSDPGTIDYKLGIFEDLFKGFVGVPKVEGKSGVASPATAGGADPLGLFK